MTGRFPSDTAAEGGTPLERAGLAICIPLLDEQGTIGPVLSGIGSALGPVPHTLCIVDDGSRDGSLDVVAQAVRDGLDIHLIRRPRSGPGCLRGSATREGLAWLAANTGHRVFADIDADGAQPPSELPEMAGLVADGSADVVIASKYLPGARVSGRPPLRRLASRAYSLGMAVMIGGGLSDYSNSFRCYSRQAAGLALAIEPRYETPLFLLEMVCAWRAAGLRITERPTCYVERSAGRSKVGLSDLARGAVGGLGVAIRYRAGGYRPSPA